MLTHVVLFKLDDPSKAADLADLLEQLHGRIEGLRSITAGADVLRSDRSWDLAVVAVFDDMAALEHYQTHPEHLAVATQIRGAMTQAAAVDF